MTSPKNQAICTSRACRSRDLRRPASPGASSAGPGCRTLTAVAGRPSSSASAAGRGRPCRRRPRWPGPRRVAGPSSARGRLGPRAGTAGLQLADRSPRTGLRRRSAGVASDRARPRRVPSARRHGRRRRERTARRRRHATATQGEAARRTSSAGQLLRWGLGVRRGRSLGHEVTPAAPAVWLPSRAAVRSARGPRRARQAADRRPADVRRRRAPLRPHQRRPLPRARTGAGAAR